MREGGGASACKNGQRQYCNMPPLKPMALKGVGGERGDRVRGRGEGRYNVSALISRSSIHSKVSKSGNGIRCHWCAAARRVQRVSIIHSISFVNFYFNLFYL
jgi:hypothetical protein